jgi:ribosomal protein S18 acetylase RimI-like enzyme
VRCRHGVRLLILKGKLSVSNSSLLTVPPVIRSMTPADLKMVCQIDRDAFETYRRQQHQLTRPLRLRTPENMDAAIRRPYPGVVIESPPGKVVGYCFTHVWGSLGWLGTLGVAPPQQGAGLGRAVIAGGLELLREAGCRTLALETMPESGKNLALYIREGLEPRHMTLLCQGTPDTASETHFDRWNGGEELRTVAGRLFSGLDPTSAARWLADEASGETLIWRENGQPAAFAALRRAPRRIDNVPTHLTVETAACLPEVAAHWPRYLSEMQAYAEREGKCGLVLPVNTRQIHLLRRTLGAGFKIVHTRVRMVSGETIGAPDAILMITMAM